MPSKKRKYNARFPAGRIKKIMQTDEEVGKVAQAVPVIISRTLELFVESLLGKALQVTTSRNAKTLSPSHVKQCILAESRFDFLRDLVKNIPDVSAAEEKEAQMSAESSPNSSRFVDASTPRRIAREDSTSSSSSEVKIQPVLARENLKRTHSADDVEFKPKIETITSNSLATETAIDLTKRSHVQKQPRYANFYNDLNLTPALPVPAKHKSVITVNPTYSAYPQLSPQPSTSSYAPLAPLQRVDVPKTITPRFYVETNTNNNSMKTPPTPDAPTIAPILNIDFSKNVHQPEIKVLDSNVASVMGVTETNSFEIKPERQNSKQAKSEYNKKDDKAPVPPLPVDIDYYNSGNLQIDEDYDT